MATDKTRAVGVDIGGTGIKAAIVDLEAGTLLSDRIKVATPAGAEPKDVLGGGQGGARRSWTCSRTRSRSASPFPRS